MKKTALFAMTFLLLASCAITSNDVKEDVIKIGGLFALTGGGADWGINEKNAAELAFEEANQEGGVNGKQLKLVIEDFATNERQAVTALQKLANIDNVNMIIGPTWAEASSAIAPILTERKILVISPSSGAKKSLGITTDYFFTIWANDVFEVRALMKYFKENDYESFAIIYSLEPFSTYMKDYFVEEAERNGLEVAVVLSQNPDDLDYRTNLLKIKQLGVDCVYLPLSAIDQNIGVVAKQSVELGLNATLATVALSESQLILEQYGDFLNGFTYPRPIESKSYEEFVQKYEEKFGTKPSSPSAATAYDAAKLLIHVMRQGARTPDEVRKALHQVKDFPGVSNTITFDEYGDVKSREFVIKQIRNGKFVVIEDFE